MTYTYIILHTSLEFFRQAGHQVLFSDRQVLCEQNYGKRANVRRHLDTGHFRRIHQDEKALDNFFNMLVQ